MKKYIIGIRFTRPDYPIVEEQESELILGRSGGSSGSSDRSRRRSGEAEEKESGTQSAMQTSAQQLLPNLRLSYFVLTDEHNVTLYGTRLVYYERKRLKDVIATDVAAEEKSNNESNNENDELFSFSSSSFSMPSGTIFFSFFFLLFLKNVICTPSTPVPQVHTT